MVKVYYHGKHVGEARIDTLDTRYMDKGFILALIPEDELTPEQTPLLCNNWQVYANHPIREMVASLTTRGEGSYYDNQGVFEELLAETLSEYSVSLDPIPLWGESGRANVRLYCHGVRLETFAVVSWYKMPVSGRYEVTVYLS